MRAKLPSSDLSDAAMRHLPTVTLIAVTSVAVHETIAALRRSSAELRFARSILLSDACPSLDAADGIEWRQIRRLGSRSEYSRFMVEELVNHIETEHILCVQWDGFVIRGQAWTDAFLDYDFIGARWPQFDQNSVGNGGFSLRSRKLLEAAKHIELRENEAEDIAICRRYRPALEELGIRFAPPHVADLFAYERSPPSGNELGFHGIFNFRTLLGPKALRHYVAKLDPGLIGERERRDLLKHSLGSLELRLAIHLLRKRAAGARRL
jgi:hypothetical protein